MNVSISKGTLVDSIDLALSTDSASGTFTNLIIGTYAINVNIYDGSALIGTGTGQATVTAGQTSTVRITVTLFSGNLRVIVDWIIAPVIFEDHFNDLGSLSHWIHTTDFSGGGQFQVVDSQFQRTQAGHVFYYNKIFSCGNGTYEFKAKGQWVFFWRGSTQDSTSGTALALVNTDGTLYYFECLWSGSTYRYHNNYRPRTESIVVGQFLTDSFNQIKILDVDSTANIYVNNQLKLSFVISQSFRAAGYIEIGANHQLEATAYDDIVITR